MKKLPTTERRARLATRHGFARALSSPVAVAEQLVALHSTDPASVFLGIAARTAPVSPQAIEAALYEQRSLVRMIGMRRTMFVVPAPFAPVVQAASSDAVEVASRKRYVQLLTEAGVGDAAWLRDLEEAAEQALAKLGEATGTRLSTAEPRLRTPITMPTGTVNATTWVLVLLSARGRIVRGRPNGGWTSSQYTWSAQSAEDVPAPIPVGSAQVDLVRRWLQAFGPATVADLKWWTGWTLGTVRKALTEIGPEEVDVDGVSAIVLPGDTAPTRPAKPWTALLPALDSTPMGWQERSWFLGPHASAVFDRSGNIGPTVWSDGRIVGGWAQRPDGSIAYRLLEDVGSAVAAAIAAQAERLSAWIGPVRVTPRFRTPLERELTNP